MPKPLYLITGMLALTGIWLWYSFSPEPAPSPIPSPTTFNAPELSANLRMSALQPAPASFASLYGVAQAQAQDEAGLESLEDQLETSGYLTHLIATTDSGGNHWLLLAAGDYLSIAEARDAAARLQTTAGIFGEIIRLPPDRVVAALRNTDFVQQTATMPFQCSTLPGYWSARPLIEGIGGFQEYRQLSETQIGSTVPAEFEAGFALARLELEEAVNTLLNQAWVAEAGQTGIATQNPGPENTETRLRNRSQHFSKTLTPLLQLLNLLQENTMIALHQELNTCVRQHAFNTLQVISALDNDTIALESATHNAEAPTMYMTQTLQRFQALSAYANPFILILLNTDISGAATPDQDRVLTYWLNSTSEDAAFLQSASSSPEISGLLADMETWQNTPRQQWCASNRQAVPANDKESYFGRKRQEFRAAMREACDLDAEP